MTPVTVSHLLLCCHGNNLVAPYGANSGGNRAGSNGVKRKINENENMAACMSHLLTRTISRFSISQSSPSGCSRRRPPSAPAMTAASEPAATDDRKRREGHKHRLWMTSPIRWQRQRPGKVWLPLCAVGGSSDTFYPRWPESEIKFTAC